MNVLVFRNKIKKIKNNSYLLNKYCCTVSVNKYRVVLFVCTCMYTFHKQLQDQKQLTTRKNCFRYLKLISPLNENTI